MSDDILSRDANRVTVLAGVTDDASEDIKQLKIDATTGRLLVSLSGVLSGTLASAETPTGTINGSNAVFTLAHTPSSPVFLLLFLNGVVQSPAGVDFTLSTATITFNTAPPTDSGLICWYIY